MAVLAEGAIMKECVHGNIVQYYETYQNQEQLVVSLSFFRFFLPSFLPLSFFVSNSLSC